MKLSEQRITDILARLAIELRAQNRQVDADAVLAGRSAIQARCTVLAFTAAYGLEDPGIAGLNGRGARPSPVVE